MKCAKSRLMALTVLFIVAAFSALPAAADVNVLITGNRSTDAYVDQWVRTRNLGKIKYLRVSNGYGAYGRYKWDKRTLVRFDLSSIPKGSTIVRAELYLYYCSYWDTNPGGRTLACYRNRSSWSETAVTWNTKPTHVSSAKYSTVPYRYGIMAWWVTNDVNLFVNKSSTCPNYGWTIKDTRYWGKYNIPVTIFYSREIGSSLRPSLSVTYRTGDGCEVPDDVDEDGLEPDQNPVATETAEEGSFVAGDLNCDGVVDFEDIDPFVLALSGQVAHQAQYPDCNWLNADCNQDGKVDFGDIDPFVELLSG